MGASKKKKVNVSFYYLDTFSDAANILLKKSTVFICMSTPETAT
jgi:hypothetical protein